MRSSDRKALAIDTTDSITLDFRSAETEGLPTMRCDYFARIAVALALAAGLTGCKGLNFGRLCNRCSTCESSVSEPYVVGDSFVSGGFVSGGVVASEPGCTTCQKSFAESPEPVVVNEPVMVDAMDGLMLPPPDSHAAYSVNPEEQPIQPEPAKTEEPKQPVKVEAPTTPMPTAPPTTSSNKPGAINIDVRSSMSVAMVGQEVTFDVSLANSGGMAIDAVDMTAVFSEGLRPKSVTPEGVARIEGQRVIFESIRRFTPMTLSYRIIAEATPGMPESKVTVEASSPILSAGPIKRETVVRITP